MIKKERTFVLKFLISAKKIFRAPDFKEYIVLNLVQLLKRISELLSMNSNTSRASMKVSLLMRDKFWT